jgi:hypothetical protein
MKANPPVTGCQRTLGITVVGENRTALLRVLGMIVVYGSHASEPALASPARRPFSERSTETQKVESPAEMPVFSRRGR